LKNQFVAHVPHNSIPLGPHLLNLPGFSHNLKQFFKDYLVWSKKYFKMAVEAAKTESLLFEMDFSLVDALSRLSEACILSSEYRVRVLNYKYAKYKELDRQRKLQRLAEKRRLENNAASQDDNLLYEELEKELDEGHSKDPWEEQKIAKEKLEIVNAKK